MYPRQPPPEYTQQNTQAPQQAPAYTQQQPQTYFAQPIHNQGQTDNTLRNLFKMKCVFACASTALAIAFVTGIYGILYITIDGYGDEQVGIGLAIVGGILLFASAGFFIWGCMVWKEFRSDRESATHNPIITTAMPPGQFSAQYASPAQPTQPMPEQKGAQAPYY